MRSGIKHAEGDILALRPSKPEQGSLKFSGTLRGTRGGGLGQGGAISFRRGSAPSVTMQEVDHDLHASGPRRHSDRRGTGRRSSTLSVLPGECDSPRSPGPPKSKAMEELEAGMITAMDAGKVQLNQPLGQTPLKDNRRLPPFIRRLATKMLSTAIADVTLRVGDDDFPCHRVVLAAHSDYFSELFEAGFDEPQIELKGITSEAVRSMLRVLYFDATPAELLRENVKRTVQLLTIAREWVLPDVIEGILDYVDREVTDMEDLQYLIAHLGFQNEQRDVREICERRLQKHYQEIAALEDARVRAMLEKEQADKPRSSGWRWPVGAGGRRVDNWSAPMKYPRGLGW